MTNQSWVGLKSWTGMTCGLPPNRRGRHLAAHTPCVPLAPACALLEGHDGAGRFVFGAVDLGLALAGQRQSLEPVVLALAPG